MKVSLIFAAIVATLLLHSCGQQRKLGQRHSATRSGHQSFRQVNSLQRQWQGQHLYLSSESSRVVAIVQPEGVFRYSTQQGFTGRATRVVIRQARRRRQLDRDSSSLQQALLGKTTGDTGYTAAATQETRTVIRQHSTWKGPLILVLALVLLLVFLYLYLRRRLSLRR